MFIRLLAKGPNSNPNSDSKSLGIMCRPDPALRMVPPDIPWEQGISWTTFQAPCNHTSHHLNISPIIVASSRGAGRWPEIGFPARRRGWGAHPVTSYHPWAAGSGPVSDNGLLVGLRHSAGPRGKGETPFYCFLLNNRLEDINYLN